MSTNRSARPGDLLVHPVVLVALICWAVNDHHCKTAHPGWLTGKLSDIACLIVIPVLVAGSVELLRNGRAGSRPATRWLLTSALGAAVVMALINTCWPAAVIYEYGMGLLQWPLRTAFAVAQGGTSDFRAVALTMDVTDLWTLPAAVIPVLLERRRCSSTLRTS